MKNFLKTWAANFWFMARFPLLFGSVFFSVWFGAWVSDVVYEMVGNRLVSGFLVFLVLLLSWTLIGTAIETANAEEGDE